MNVGINGYYLTTLYSGIGQYTYNLLKTLSELDTRNNYWVFSPNPIDHWNFPKNFHLVVIPTLPLFRNTFINRYIWEEYQLGDAIKKYKIQLFHAMYQSLPRGSEHIGNIVTVHDAIPWRFPFERQKRSYRWYSDHRKYLVKKRAKKIITISETSKLDIAAIYGVKPEEIEVTYESVDPVFGHTPTKEELTAFDTQYSIERPFILYTGGLKRHKNLRMLIKAFAILVHDYKYTGALYVLGAIRKTMAISQAIYYNVDDLKKYAKLKKVGNQVKFVGVVSRADMNCFMHESECFVSLSLYEGFGLPAVEAMTSGVPSVLSNQGAYPEIADDAAVFVYPYGPHRIASALHDVITNKEIHKTLEKKAKVRAQFFDRHKIAKRILEIYQEVFDDYKINFQP